MEIVPQDAHILSFFHADPQWLSILMDHPRLYFNDGCTPGREWIRFAPLRVPKDRFWTAKDDNRYISPVVGLPGYCHTIGVARVWHFINVHGFIATGIVFIAMLFSTDQWTRIVPTSPLVPQAGVEHVRALCDFHLPPEPNGFYGYNALQQIAYFTVVFIFGPLAVLTGITMSPAVVKRFPWYARIFGGRIGPLDSFPHHAQLPGISRSACDAHRYDGICAKHERYCDGY